jgi:hypothetical protein
VKRTAEGCGEIPKQAWRARSARIRSQFSQTDIIGALSLASQFFAGGESSDRKMFVIFSDMREDVPGLDLESPTVVPPFDVLASHIGAVADLSGVQIDVLGADGAGKSSAYWEGLNNLLVRVFSTQ